MSFLLRCVSYEFDVAGVAALDSTFHQGRRRYTIQPSRVTLVSRDQGKTIAAAEVHGSRVRQRDREVSGHRSVYVGPHDAPHYVNDMLASLGLFWSDQAAPVDPDGELSAEAQALVDLVPGWLADPAGER